MGAEGFHGRVRDGIGCLAPRYGHQAGQALGDGWGEGEVSGGVQWGWALHAGGLAAPDGRCGRVFRGFGIKYLERLVPVGCTGCPASTPKPPSQPRQFAVTIAVRCWWLCGLGKGRTY